MSYILNYRVIVCQTYLRPTKGIVKIEVSRWVSQSDLVHTRKVLSVKIVKPRHQQSTVTASYLFMSVAPRGPMMENGSQMPDTILN